MKRMTDPMSAPAWPPTTFSLPQLWERIAAMFAVLMREARSAARLAERLTTYTERYAIRCRLIPLEKLVRSLLVTEALIHLLMTPQGRTLIATAKRITPPTPRKPSNNAPAKPRTSQLTPRDPTFRVLGWQMPGQDDEADHEHTHAAYAYPYSPGRPLTGRHLARRIHALTDVIKDREPAMLRLARFIAGLPRSALDLPAVLAVASLGWWHGRPEYFNAIALEKRAVLAFHAGGVRRDDPG